MIDEQRHASFRFFFSSPDEHDNDNFNDNDDDNDNDNDNVNHSLRGNSRNSIPILVCAFMAAGTTGGTSYAFGIYGQALKSTLSLTQSQLDTISSATFCAGIISWIPGMLVDRYGTKCGIVGGAILGATALVSFWMVATTWGDSGWMQIPRQWLVPVLSACAVLIFVACALITGSVFKILVEYTSPPHKGHAVGAAKGYVGLGSGAYAVLFESLRRNTDLDFLPMAAFFFLAAACLPALCFIPTNFPSSHHQHAPPSASIIQSAQILDRTTMAHYFSLYMGLVAMAVLVIGQSIGELLSDENTNASSQQASPDYLMIIMVPFVWFGPILGLLTLPQQQYTSLETGPLHDETSLLKVLPSSEMKLSVDSPSHDPNAMHIDNDVEDEIISHDLLQVPSNPSQLPLQDFSLWQMLQTISAWLMLWTCTILVGGGTVMTNNLGQMVQSLQFNPKVVPAALSLFSVAQSFGRVMTGSLSSTVKRRPSFLILASLAGLGSHSLLALSTNLTPFLVGVFLSGLAFGMVWPLMVLISGELFGASHVGANYMFYDGLTSALGTLALSKFVAQTVYEHHVEPGTTACFGPECFRSTNWIIAGLSATCILTSMCLCCTKLTKQTYG